MDWIPPCFSIPKKLEEIIVQKNLNADVLHYLVIPQEEQLSGKINKKSINTFLVLDTTLLYLSKNLIYVK